jgi:hypothetical protein
MLEAKGGRPLNQDRRAIEQEILVLRCQRGERAAFEELIEAWERR